MRSKNRARPVQSNILSSHDQACVALRDAIRSSFLHASSFPDFLTRVEQAGVRVRPNLSATTGSLNGIRFRSDDLYILSSALGLGASDFSSGRLKYEAETMREEVEAYTASYRQDFGECRTDEVPKARPSPRCPSLRVNRAEISVAASSHEAEVAINGMSIAAALEEEIARVNDLDPSLSNSLYVMLKCGQDTWSRSSPRILTAHAIATHGDTSRPLRAIMYMRDQDRNNALRWVCRGLEPSHALCKVVTPRLRFGVPLDERVIEVARDIHSKSRRKHDCLDYPGA